MDEHKPSSIKKIISSKKGLSLFKDRLILFIVTHFWFSILSFNQYFFLGEDMKKIQKKYKAGNFKKNKIIFRKNKSKIQETYNLYNLKYILVDQGEAFYTYPEKLLMFLVDFSKNNTKIFLKQHPGLKTLNKELVENLEPIPRELPIELIVENDTVLIGIASNALKEHNKVVSLLKIVNIKPDFTFDDYYRFLEPSEIIFPKDIFELKNRLTKLI